jgi:hypothetical protein
MIKDIHMNRQRTHLWKRVLLTLVVLAALGSGGLVLAQSSGRFDLGCWGILGNGGDVRNSLSAKVYDSLGQAATGDMFSTTAKLRAGYVQNWPPPATPAPPTSRPITGDNLLHMPIAFSSIYQPRACFR